MHSAAGIPHFISKLWNIVNDPSTDDFICWGPDETTFIIYNQNEFASHILPQYFKHNQYASFVRQLNMYGFRKTAFIEAKNDVEPQEFYNPYFQKGKQEYLYMIKRKGSNAAKATSEGATNNVTESKQVKDILLDVQAIHGKQENMDSKLEELKAENESLWREVSDLRRQHTKQEELVKTLLSFLVKLYKGSVHSNPNKRKLPYLPDASPRKVLKLSSNETPAIRKSSDNGPLIHELTDTASISSNLDFDHGIVQSPPSVLNTPNPGEISPSFIDDLGSQDCFEEECAKFFKSQFGNENANQYLLASPQTYQNIEQRPNSLSSLTSSNGSVAPCINKEFYFPTAPLEDASTQMISSYLPPEQNEISSQNVIEIPEGFLKTEKMNSSSLNVAPTQKFISHNPMQNLASHVSTVNDQLDLVKQQMPADMSRDLEKLFGLITETDNDLNTHDNLLSSSSMPDEILDKQQPILEEPIGNEIVQYVPAIMDLEVPEPSLLDLELFLTSAEPQID